MAFNRSHWPSEGDSPIPGPTSKAGGRARADRPASGRAHLETWGQVGGGAEKRVGETPAEAS